MNMSFNIDGWSLNGKALLGQLPEGLEGRDAAELIVVGGTAFVLILVMWVILGRRRRRQSVSAAVEPTLDIQVSQLQAGGPPNHGPLVTCYHVPVRVMLLVLAPLGRNSTLPSPAEIPDLVDQIVPGLGSVLEPHTTLIRRWPQQLSSRGFAHTFLSNLRLPNDRGRGSSWCALVGRFEVAGKPYLAGLALCAAQPNNLGEISIERETQWLDVLRIQPQTT